MDDSTRAWDKIFSEKGKVFTEPHEDLPGIVSRLKEMNANRILDLGSGSGRHVVYLARQGFTVFGIDASSSGIDMTRKWLLQEGLAADLQIQDIHQRLPYDDKFMDAVVSVQVIHHAPVAAIQRIIREIERVLRRGGLVFVTVPRLKNQGQEFDQIEPMTFVPRDGREKGLPHHYFTPAELRECFKNFYPVTIHLDRINHFCLLGFKKS